VGLRCPWRTCVTRRFRENLQIYATPRVRLKTGAAKSKVKTHPVRAEFFALPFRFRALPPPPSLWRDKFLRLLFLVPSVDTPAIDPAAGLSFSRALATHGLKLRRARTEILQLNVGKLCDLSCVHCHVNAGPKRKEVITRQTVDRILSWLTETNIPTVDITGGAPEMAPEFRYLVQEVRNILQIETIIDRCNLTILLEPGYEWLAEFLAAHRVRIVASMPCYQPANVNAQRGDGVFDRSISALRLLNRLGYAQQPALTLDLVYNPNGDFLPPDQTELEADYKRELKLNFDIYFNRLYTITNMPIGRFAAWL